jgi:hypothetical protein
VMSMTLAAFWEATCKAQLSFLSVTCCMTMHFYLSLSVCLSPCIYIYALLSLKKTYLTPSICLSIYPCVHTFSLSLNKLNCVPAWSRFASLWHSDSGPTPKCCGKSTYDVNRWLMGYYTFWFWLDQFQGPLLRVKYSCELNAHVWTSLPASRSLRMPIFAGLFNPLFFSWNHPCSPMFAMKCPFLATSNHQCLPIICCNIYIYILYQVVACSAPLRW